MEITFAQVENILKTLPISYYIKKKVDVKLSPTEKCSYCDLINDNIIISFLQLKQAMSNIDNSTNLENDIRCLLYHETSHAFLTPKELTVSTINNIFEDERIESILSNYYRNVNFKEFVKRINNFNYETPQSADEMFYQIVRFRYGPKHLVNEVHKIITDNYALDRRWSTSLYERSIKRLKEKVDEYFNTHNTNSEYNKSKSKSSSNPSQDKDDISDGFTNIFEQSEDIVENTNHVDDESWYAKHAIERSMFRYDDKSISDDLSKILMTAKNISKHNGTAINAYSGVFDPRSVIRDDYKYFVQSSRLGHVKAYSKLHLNLFIDCSGSFSSNDDTVNKLLHQLALIEKENADFSFDLISCGYGQKLRDKNDRIQCSNGPTELTADIDKLFKSLQYSDKNNINIVLYDGYAFEYVASPRQHCENEKYFATFNNHNTILIVDSSNEDAVTKYCPAAKKIITSAYTSELYKNVLNALQILCI